MFLLPFILPTFLRLHPFLPLPLPSFPFPPTRPQGIRLSYGGNNHKIGQYTLLSYGLPEGIFSLVAEGEKRKCKVATIYQNYLYLRKAMQVFFIIICEVN